MRNYAEELGYWYLRFNGFFPLTDFVIHRSQGRYPSDCDLLAIRTPHVLEEIGGHERDWDQQLLRCFDATRTVGVICEVKAGSINGDLFKDEYVKYSLKRFGFTSDLQQINEAVTALQLNKRTMVDSHPVFKLLISNLELEFDTENQFYSISLKHVHGFLKDRMRRYRQKRQDWVYFTSTLLQEIIWEVQLEMNEFV